MVFQEVGWGVMDWIEMAEDRDRWRAFETAAIDSVTPRPLFGPGKDPVPIVQEAGWALGPVWTGAEKFRPHWDSFPGPSSS